MMCFWLKISTTWSNYARLSLPGSSLVCTLFPLCLPCLFHVPCDLFHIPPLHTASQWVPLCFPPSLILIDPLHPSLLKMCLFPSFVFKDVAWIRWWLGNIVLLSCICDSQSGNFDENNRDLTRRDQAMSLDASAYARLDRGYTSIKYALISKEVLQTFTWDITWKHCFFKTFADGINYPCNTVEDKSA